MKRLSLVVLVLLVSFGIFAPSVARVFDHVSVTASVEARQNPATLTVYITKTGEKYHNDGCRYLRQSRIRDHATRSRQARLRAMQRVQATDVMKGPAMSSLDRFKTLVSACLLAAVLAPACGGGDDEGGGLGPSNTLPSSWTGTLPATSVVNGRPVCQATLPAQASCINNLTGPPTAICTDRAFSCSTDSGTCSSHGGVHCWRNYNLSDS